MSDEVSRMTVQADVKSRLAAGIKIPAPWVAALIAEYEADLLGCCRIIDRLKGQLRAAESPTEGAET